MKSMTRRYQLGRRAALQEETRQRIVEAAVELHEAVGVARTSVTQIAERAGVGRLTVYRHFPDELALGTACTGLYWQRNPWPDLAAWRKIADPIERLEVALHTSYAYHHATAAMMVRAFADVVDSPIMAPYLDHWRLAADVVVAAWRVRGRKRTLLRAAIGHALLFPTWHSLHEQGLTDEQSVELMLRLTCDCESDS